MKKTKIFALALALAMAIMALAPLNTVVLAAEKTNRVVLDGTKLTLATQPRLVNGHLLVSLDGVLQDMGATVLWNKDTKTVTILRRDAVVKLVVNSKTARVNTKKKQMGIAPQIYKNKVYVPLRFVAESLGAKVKWSSSTRTMTITTDKAHWSDPGDNLSLHLLFASTWVDTDGGTKMTFDPEMFIQINDTWPDGADSDDLFYSYSETNEDERNMISMFMGGAHLKDHWIEFNPNTRILTEYLHGDALISWRIQGESE